MATKKSTGKYLEIDISKIDPPAEVDRITIGQDKINELADSIKAVGLLQPISLAKKKDRYEIVFGHRRFLACKQIGIDRILANVLDYTPEQIAIIRATENLQREDLTPLEEAKIYCRLVVELGMTLDKAGQMTGKSAGVVKRRIDLLRMPEKAQQALHERKISIAVAEELWRCPDEGHRDYLTEMAIEHGVTRIVAKAWVDDYLKGLRTKQHDVEGGGGVPSVFETNPVFISCDTCRGPEEISKVKGLRVCASCFKIIMDNLRA